MDKLPEVLMLVLLMLLGYCLGSMLGHKEHFQQNARGSDNSRLKSSSKQLYGKGQSDGIYTGFEDRDVDQLKMLQYRFETWIKPTLKRFLTDYETSNDVQETYRLARPGTPLTAQERTDFKNMVRRVMNVSQSDIYENKTPAKGETSYTINKDQIYMCLKNSEGRVHDQNILLFAFIHELAHVGCQDVGHTDEFWAHFRALLYLLCKYTYPGQQAKPNIKYCEIDLRQQPYHNYCNKMKVFYNPLFDRDAFMHY